MEDAAHTSINQKQKQKTETDKMRILHECEQSRAEYQSTMAHEVPSAARGGATRPKRKALLEGFFWTIHKHTGTWNRLPQFEDCYKIVESRHEVNVQLDDENM